MRSFNFKFLKAVRNKKRSGRGGALHEYLIVFPIFIIFIIFFIDISLFWATNALLEFGAMEGVRLAAKTDGIEVDVEWLNACAPSDPATPTERNRFVSARKRVLDATLRLPGSTMARVGRFYIYSVPSYGATSGNDTLAAPFNVVGVPGSKPAILVRPRESFSRSGQTYYHDTCYNSSAAPGGPYGGIPCTPTPVTSSNCTAARTEMSQLLKDHPLVVYLDYDFNWFVPFLPNTTIRTKALSYRERIWDGTVPEPFNPPTTTVTTTSTSSTNTTSTSASSTTSTSGTSTTSTSSTTTTSLTSSTTSTSTSGTSTTSTSLTSTTSTSTTSTSSSTSTSTTVDDGGNYTS